MFQLRYKIKWIAIATSFICITGFILTTYSAIRYASAMDESAVDKVELADLAAPDTLYLTSIHIYPLAADSAEKRLTIFRNQVMLYEAYDSDNGFVLANTLLSVKAATDKNMKLTALKTARGSSALQALRAAQELETQVMQNGKQLGLNNRIFVDDHAFAYQQLEYELQLPVGTIIKTDRNIAAMIHRAYETEDFDNGTTFLVTTKGLVCLDATIPLDVDDNDDQDELEINLGIDDAGVNDRKHFRISINDDDLLMKREKRIYVDKENCKTEVETKVGRIEIKETH